MKAKFITISIILCAAVAALGYFFPKALWLYVLVLPIVLVGLSDVFQTSQSLKHNFSGYWSYALVG